MDEFDDIVLDEYDSFLGDKGKGNSDDPLDTSSSNNDTRSKKRSNQDDRNDAEDAAAPSKKQRMKLKKLDHKVLMAPEGLPRLRNETPWLEFKDDHDVGQNLDKLIQYYRSWAYNIYPRLNFADFSSRIMKSTANKECKEMLKCWREEYIFKNSEDAGGDTSSHDHTAGGLSGLTLEDIEKNSQNSDDNSDSSDSSDDDNSDRHDNRPPKLSPTEAPTNSDEASANDNEETSQKGNAGDKTWAAMMDSTLDENDGDLFLSPPVATNSSITTSTNNLTVDDFFAD